MNIARRFLIHLKCRISVSEKILLIFDGNHILLYENLIIRTIVYFDVTCSQINSKCIVSHYSHSSLSSYFVFQNPAFLPLIRSL